MVTKMEKDSGDFVRIFNAFIDKESYDPKGFVYMRNIKGQSFGLESNLKASFLLGNAYVEGYIGEFSIRVFYRDTQGFQVFISPLGKEFEDTPTFTFPVYERIEMNAEIAHRIGGRYSYKR